MKNWKSLIKKGSEAKIINGSAVTLKNNIDCLPYWFSSYSTIILGGEPSKESKNDTETVAIWNFEMQDFKVHKNTTNFLVISCIRYFGGLHSYHFNARMDLYVNNLQIDGFALRIKPENHSDYFHRVDIHDLPLESASKDYQTKYLWVLPDNILNNTKKVEIKIRIDKEVRWDIDQVELLFSNIKSEHTIFLSHNWKDKDIARIFAQELLRRNIGVWIDEGEIKIGDSLIQKIRQGIDEVKYVLALVSSNSIKSEWVNKELDIAINQEILNKKVKVLPVIIGKIQPPGFLLGKLYAKLDRKSKEQIVNIVNMIEKRLTEDGY